MRRVSQSLYYMATGARNHSFKSHKSIAECLADEIINAGKVKDTNFTLICYQIY